MESLHYSSYWYELITIIQLFLLFITTRQMFFSDINYLYISTLIVFSYRLVFFVSKGGNR